MLRNVDAFNILSIKPEEKIRMGGVRHSAEVSGDVTQ